MRVFALDKLCKPPTRATNDAQNCSEKCSTLFTGGVKCYAKNCHNFKFVFVPS